MVSIKSCTSSMLMLCPIFCSAFCNSSASMVPPLSSSNSSKIVRIWSSVMLPPEVITCSSATVHLASSTCSSLICCTMRSNRSMALESNLCISVLGRSKLSMSFCSVLSALSASDSKSAKASPPALAPPPPPPPAFNCFLRSMMVRFFSFISSFNCLITSSSSLMILSLSIFFFAFCVSTLTNCVCLAKLSVARVTLLLLADADIVNIIAYAVLRLMN
mmetsp:Transcript_52677/g.83928  ORF Transcript_52677/g.83928 Transcript_52677/m.83928 type:complete len:218 (+) Transcript_52677:305-958(+)